ncbi:Uncharacterised protein [Mycobacteroides abscessus subsp. abscessus]|nr:Uncharacterised protein [Mycobacteroides abscessus subsp. abscessus]SHY32009.1 Uncharacterised protein [Mycobacteroides abscessus subsp. abscessus]SIB14703.1 Uncharacterised protein [Mycobacteroides abscessus subsp. abscessus]SIC38552.1 Uncharacterised protein [Mycobacteroides abscessus subsp. abscessus]SIC78801.1 Uncharacterised protein [Mycobacteroides abscessus subsp. abscessus]
MPVLIVEGYQGGSDRNHAWFLSFDPCPVAVLTGSHMQVCTFELTTQSCRTWQEMNITEPQSKNFATPQPRRRECDNQKCIPQIAAGTYSGFDRVDRSITAFIALRPQLMPAPNDYGRRGPAATVPPGSPAPSWSRLEQQAQLRRGPVSLCGRVFKHLAHGIRDEVQTTVASGGRAPRPCPCLTIGMRMPGRRRDPQPHLKRRHIWVSPTDRPLLTKPVVQGNRLGVLTSRRLREPTTKPQKLQTSIGDFYHAVVRILDYRPICTRIGAKPEGPVHQLSG